MNDRTLVREPMMIDSTKASEQTFERFLFWRTLIFLVARMLQIALATPRQHIQIAAFEDLWVRERVDVQVVFDESAQAGILVTAAQSRRRRRAEWNGINLDCGLLRGDPGWRVGWTNWGLAIGHPFSILLVSGRSHAS